MKIKGEMFHRESYDIFMYIAFFFSFLVRQNRILKDYQVVLGKDYRSLWISNELKNGLNVLSCSQPLAFTFCVSYI